MILKIMMIVGLIAYIPLGIGISCKMAIWFSERNQKKQVKGGHK